MTRVKAATRRTFASLMVRNYRLYFTGQAISQSGTWMQTIGQAWLVLRLTGSGTALGLVTALQFLPMLLLGPWGGLIADRLPKRRVLYATQTASGLLAAGLGVLVATGAVRLWMVYVLAAALGLITTVDIPTRQTFVLEMVGPDDLTNAVTLNSVVVNLARAVGPALAGGLIATVGLAACFFVNAASYLAVLIALALMRAADLHVVRAVPRVKGQLREGLRYVRSTPVLRDALIMMAVIGTLSYEFQVILPLLARYTFHGNAGTYGLLTAAIGAGAVAGGLLTAGRRRAGASGLVTSAFAFGVVILLAAAAPVLGAEIAALVMVGAASIVFLARANTTLQLEARPEMRGRVMALWAVAFIGSTPIGGPTIGWIGQHAGPRWGLAVGGAAAVATAGLGALAMVHARRREAAQLPDAREITPVRPATLTRRSAVA